MLGIRYFILFDLWKGSRSQLSIDTRYDILRAGKDKYNDIGSDSVIKFFGVFGSMDDWLGALKKQKNWPGQQVESGKERNDI